MTVHILHHGQALCDQQGTPDQWPEDHRWVGIEKADESTCVACRREVIRQLLVRDEEKRKRLKS